MTEEHNPDFRWCPFCGCDEALMTSHHVNAENEEDGVIIYCPECERVTKAEVVQWTKEEEVLPEKKLPEDDSESLLKPTF